MNEEEFEREQEEAAAADAAAIGGSPGAEPYTVDGEHADPAQVPLMEAGEGESEGFEQAEQELIDHASHADQHAARRVLQDAWPAEEAAGSSAGEADHEASSERPAQD